MNGTKMRRATGDFDAGDYFVAVMSEFLPHLFSKMIQIAKIDDTIKTAWNKDIIKIIAKTDASRDF